MEQAPFLTLKLGADLREEIAYSNHAVPFSICIDSFDAYLNNQWPLHWHDEHEFVFVLQGCATFSVHDSHDKHTDLLLREGDGLYIGSACLHSAQATPGTVTAGYVFSDAFFQMKPFESVLMDLLQPITDSAVTYIRFERASLAAKPILETLDVLCHLPKDETEYQLHSVELVFRLWRLLLQYIRSHEIIVPRKAVPDTRVQRLKAMLSFVHAHYSEAFTVDTLAAHCGISRTECFRCFQSILQKTPTDYLLEYRLSMAAAQLLNTRKSASEIAEACGFQSASYFGKRFRDQFGVSPMAYRKNNLLDTYTKQTV